MSNVGYSTTECVLSPRECDTLGSVLDGSIPRGRAGARHLMTITEIAALARDPRLLELAERALGSPAVPYRATLFAKSGEANWLVVWHQDTALPLASKVASDEWGRWSSKAGVLYAHAPTWALQRIVALRIHVDASTLENGPLRVIPGSHREGVLTAEQVFCIARKRQVVDCLVDRGGVLAMQPVLIHSSSKAKLDQPRRVIHIEYADSLDLGPGLRLAEA